MARTIVVNFDGEVSEFGITRVRRDKLYGRRVKEVVDEEGNPTQSAYLTRDGSALLPSGSMSMIYVDDEFDVTERSDLVAVGPDGEPLEPVESTLGVEQRLEGPIDPQRVLDHLAKSVYELSPDALGPKLKAALEDGDIFETRFAYRRGFDDSPVFLLRNDEAFFALVGEETTFDFLYRAQNAGLEEDEEEEDLFEDDDELDFSMF